MLKVDYASTNSRPPQQIFCSEKLWFSVMEVACCFFNNHIWWWSFAADQSLCLFHKSWSEFWELFFWFQDTFGTKDTFETNTFFKPDDNGIRGRRQKVSMGHFLHYMDKQRCILTSFCCLRQMSFVFYSIFSGRNPNESHWKSSMTSRMPVVPIAAHCLRHTVYRSPYKKIFLRVYRRRGECRIDGSWYHRKIVAQRSM